jgi:hypothetical protein
VPVTAPPVPVLRHKCQTAPPHCSDCAFGFTSYKDLQMRYEKKIIFNGQMRNELFLIVIYHSSLVKAAVNALHL